MHCNVIFQPTGCQGSFAAGTELMAAARKLGIAMESPCGGSSRCGKCKVRIVTNAASVSPITDKEREVICAAELAGGYRLACCVLIVADIVVEVSKVEQIVLEDGITRACSLEPAVVKYTVNLHKPTLQDLQDDCGRLQSGLQSRFIQLNKQLTFDHSALAALPQALRQREWEVTATIWQGKEIIAVEAGNTRELYGVAMDIGTTTLAAYLCDLTSGNLLAQTSQVNSQVSFGDDVLSRISAVADEGGLEDLRQTVLKDMNEMLQRLALQAGITTGDIYDAVLVFNTVMHHLVLGFNPEAVGQAPFISVCREAMDVKARDLGLKIAKGAYVHCLPLVAGFVGADNVAAMISEKPYQREEMTLLVDIGTNGEIDFGNQKGFFTASCATGPALEGAQISFGMRAAAGAIEKVAIDSVSKEPVLGIISSEEEAVAADDKSKARGICGSGIIDAVAELFKAGIIKADGTFCKNIGSDRVRRDVKGRWEYVLAWADKTVQGQDITITQKDVRAVQLAKAALYAGAKILMRKKGVEKVEHIILAGAFGNYINKENAMVLGMIPDCRLAEVSAVGNAAGEGAKRALLARKERNEAREIAKNICFVETAAESNFQEEFLAAMFLPHQKDDFPHIKKILANIPSG